MRLLLIPISTRRTLIYGQRLNKITHSNPSWADKASTRAANLWMKWETGDKKWQRSLTEQGNKLFNKISFEEWGLKSIPPLSARRKEEEIAGAKIEVIYPPSVLPEKNIPGILKRLGTERNLLHRTRLMWSFIGMPIAAPFGLVPVIPNIPFFYLMYRAFCHWKALEGGKHINFLLNKNLIQTVESKELDDIYTRRNMNAVVDQEALTKEAKILWKGVKKEIGTEQEQGTDADSREDLLIHDKDAQDIAALFNVPALAMETERAVRQVADQLRKAHEVAQRIRIEPAQEATTQAEAKN